MKLIKKVCAAVLCMTAALCLTAAGISAYAQEYVLSEESGGHVYDYNSMLTEDEVQRINQLIDETSEKTKMNICVVINDGVLKSPYDDSNYVYQDYADVFYEDLYGMNTDGVCLFIRFEPNYVYFSTSGIGQKYYNSVWEPICSDMGGYLRNRDIYGAVHSMCSDMEHYKKSYDNRWFRYLLVGLLVGFIAAVIAFFVVRSRYKRHGKTPASVYIDQSSEFTEKNDIFIREYTTKTKIETNNSSGGGGGGGSHTSSGGGSHGGGGSSF